MALLAPTVTSPISECNTSVEVKGMLTGAEVHVSSDNNLIAHGTAHWSKQIFQFNPGVTLQPGAKITATQKSGSDTSPSSPPVIIQKKPPSVGQVLFGGPVYVCGSCLTTNGASPGAVVEIISAGSPRGQAAAPTGEARIKLSQPTQANDLLEALQTVCGMVGQQKTSAGAPFEPPRPLPTPVIAPTPRACETTVRVAGVTVGATLTL